MNYYVKPLLKGRLETALANIDLYSNKLSNLETVGQNKGTQFSIYCEQQLEHWKKAAIELESLIEYLNISLIPTQNIN